MESSDKALKTELHPRHF